MKLISVLLFSVFVSAQQVETVNCVIMIDGLLVENLCENSIVYQDKSGLKQSITFGYEVGQLKFRPQDFETLKSLTSSMIVTVNLGNCDLETYGEKKSYLLKQELDNIINQRYLIFRIFNCKNCDEYKCFTESPKYHNPLPKMKNKRKLIKCK